MNIETAMVDTAIGQTRQHYRHLGLELPESLTQALARAAATNERTIPPYDAAALCEAVDAALDEGRDPAADETVRTQLARKAIKESNVWQMLEGLALQRRGEALRDSAGQIIANLSGVVDQANAVLVQARQEIPGLDVTDPSNVSTLRPGQMALWGEARDAVDHLNRVTQVWHLIVSACRLAPLGGPNNPLILADLSADELAALDRNTDAMAPVHAGHALALADVETYKQRVRSVEQQRAEQRAQRAREALTGRREASAA